jgi:predicted MFS family arabinose efflux permease
VRRARVAVTSAFAAHAILSGSLGPWIPHLKERAGLDPAGLGLALTGFAVGLVTGTRLAGPAVRRLGGRGAVRVGVPLLGVGFALLPVGTDLLSLSVIFLGIGLLAGLVDVAMNIEAVGVERRFGRRVMTSIHGMWSVSVFVGAAAASLGVAARIPIGVFLPIFAGFVVAASFSLLRWLPVAEAARPAVDVTAPRERSDRIVLLLCLVAGGSFLMEGIAIEWSAVFLRESVGVDPSIAGLGVVAFSAGMAVSRFVGDRVVAHVGQPAVVRVGASSALLAFGIMLIVPSAATSIVAFGVVGLGLGPVVPLAFRSAGSIETRGRRSALPIVVTAGYVGSIVGPLVVGFIADGFGLRVAFLVPLVAVAVAAFAAPATREAAAQPTSPSIDT